MAVCTRYMPCELVYETNLRCCDYDGIILVSGSKPGTDEPEPFKSTLCEALEIDEALFKSGAVLPVKLPAKRLIYSPTGPLNPDYDDVRSFGEAAVSGIKRALSAGVRKPLLILLPDCRYENVELVTLLGALEALYVPLEVREISAEKACKVKTLAVWSPSCSKKIMGIMNQAIVLESGRFVARDIGGPDPERMAPPRVEEYIKQLFENSRVCVHSISDTLELLEDYPLFACVNRAASVVPRHAGRVIYMTYEPADQSCIKNTYIFIGKGVTYDTGGADIKTSLSMAGMSRDKCGAAAAIGLMQVVNLLQPSNIKVIAAIGVVRNSSGENNYVSDEVITAKSGARVRVNNTDAEGRMVMADILYHAKERACNTINPYLFTIATLTGHAKNTVGSGYSIAMDNSIARECKVAENLRLTGDLVGEPVEVSIIRREDFKTHKGRAEGDDVIQSGSSKSAKSQRGHQAPAAFLMMASGLNKHGKGSEKPLKYTHIDIAASAGELPDQPTGAPIISLSSRLFNEELKELENSGSDLITVKNKIPEN